MDMVPDFIYLFYELKFVKCLWVFFVLYYSFLHKISF